MLFLFQGRREDIDKKEDSEKKKKGEDSMGEKSKGKKEENEKMKGKNLFHEKKDFGPFGSHSLTKKNKSEIWPFLNYTFYYYYYE